MQHAKVAVVIPVHNGARTLAATLDDLLAQSFDDFTITIVENASTDGTLAIAEDYSRADPRVSVDISTTLLPPIQNFARAMQIGTSRGSYVMLRACDDTAAPDYLEKLVAALDAHANCQFAVGVTKLVGGPKGERFKRPAPAVFDFARQYASGRPPRNMTFPAEWIYGLFRAECTPRLSARWTALGTPWCAASYALFDFVIHDEVAFVPDAVFVFVEGSGSNKTYGARGLRERLRRRLDYSLGCFALRHTLPPVSPLATVRFFLMCWADSRRKTGYKLLGFL